MKKTSIYLLSAFLLMCSLTANCATASDYSASYSSQFTKANATLKANTILEADSLIDESENEKNYVLEEEPPESSWNMVTKDLSDGDISFFYFDMYDYSLREFAYDSSSKLSTASEEILTSQTQTLLVDADSNVQTSEGFQPAGDNDSENSSIQLTSIIGSDERSLVSDPSEFPYRTTGYLYTEYYNVYNNSTKKYVTRAYRGTAFLEGPDLIVTAGHCVYGDVSASDDGDTTYDDNIDNPRFADKIVFYPARNGSVIPYEVTVDRIYLESSYYENLEKDWACCKLSTSIGNTVGWQGKISNFYEEDYDVYTYGYPSDKGRKMYEASGQMTGMTDDYEYITNYDSYGGQSGSPVLLTKDGNEYVCGIHVAGSSTQNYATRIDSFMFAFMNSFVTSETDKTHNYVSLAVDTKDGSYWHIMISNGCTKKLTIEYNSKMCYFDDAKNWTNLSDIESVEIGALSSTVVKIKTNWFATSIATSYTMNGYRYITYANNLNSSGTLTQYTNRISV